MLQAFQDSYNIIRFREKFILGELADRAIQNEGGYALTYALPLLFIKKYPMAVLTGKEIIQTVLTQVNSDPESRKMFEPLERMLGVRTVINEFDFHKVSKEKEMIKNALSFANASLITQAVLSELEEEWGEQPIEKVARLACVRMIASALLGIKTGITYETLDSLDKEIVYLFHPEKMEEPAFKLLQEDLQAGSRSLFEENKVHLLQEGSYLKYVSEKNEKPLETINMLAALVVETNITKLVTGILSKLKESPEWERKLREEYENPHDDKERLSFVDQLYFEGLRYFPPEEPIVRYASRPIGPFPAGTMFFIPLKKIMRDPKIWDKPEEFNPFRHTKKIHLGEYPWIMFSLNKSGRVCPAAHTRFAETIVKAILARLYGRKTYGEMSRNSVLTFYQASRSPSPSPKPLATLPVARLAESFSHLGVKKPRA